MRAIIVDENGEPMAPDHEDGELRVEFEGREHPFVCGVLVCSDPGCLGVHLTFDGGEPGGSRGGLSFSGTIDPASAVLEPMPGSTPEARDLIAEFNRDATPETVAFLRRRGERAREHWRRAAHFRMPAEEIRQGILAAYPDVFYALEDASPEETACSFWITRGEDSFAFIDQYCMNPDCNCRNVHLSAFRLIDEIEAEEVFTVRLDLRGRTESFTRSSIPRAEAEEILARLRAEEPDLGATLAGHYEEMRAVGARLLEEGREARRSAPARPGRPGRNDPCPCGSGHKYKRCCAGKDGPEGLR